MPVPDVSGSTGDFQIGRAVELRAGTDLTVIATGTMVCRALDAARELKADAVSAAVLNVSTIRPIDRQAIVKAARRGPIITVEEHTVHGGLGSAVAEIVVDSHPTPMRILGVPGVFAPTGYPPVLLPFFKLSP